MVMLLSLCSILSLSLSLSLFFPSSFQLHDMNASLSSSSYSFPFFVLMFCLQSPNLFLHARVSARSPRCSWRFRQCLRSRCCVAPRLPRRHAQGRRHRAGPRPQGSAPAAASSSSIRRCFSRRWRARWVGLHEGQAHRPPAQGRRRHDRRRGVRSPLRVRRCRGEALYSLLTKSVCR